MNFEFMNMINMHLENQRLYEEEVQKSKEKEISERRERIIHEVLLGITFLIVFLLDTPH